MLSTVIVAGKKYRVNLQSSILKNSGFLSKNSGPICGLQPPPTLPSNPKRSPHMVDLLLSGLVYMAAVVLGTVLGIGMVIVFERMFRRR